MNYLCILKYQKDMLIDTSIEDVITEFMSNAEGSARTFRNASK